MKHCRLLSAIVLGLGASAAMTGYRMYTTHVDLRSYFAMRGLLEALMGITIFLAILLIASWNSSRRVLWAIFGVCAISLGIGMLSQSRFAYIPSTAFIWAMSASAIAAEVRDRLALALVSCLWVVAGVARFCDVLH